MIKQGEIDTFDYKEYCLNEFGRVEEKLYSKQEILVLYAIYKLSKKYKSRINIGYCPSVCSFCFYKTPLGSWQIMYSGERRDGCIYAKFDNIYSALFLLLHFFHVKSEDLPKLEDEFNSIINSEISYTELEQFVGKIDCYDNNFYNDFEFIIKKNCNIEVNETELSNVLNRINARKNTIRNEFNYLIFVFLKNVARKLDIDFTKYDYTKSNNSYNEYFFEQINRKNNKDVILEELKKYNNNSEYYNENPKVK